MEIKLLDEQLSDKVYKLIFLYLCSQNLFHFDKQRGDASVSSLLANPLSFLHIKSTLPPSDALKTLKCSARTYLK